MPEVAFVMSRAQPAAVAELASTLEYELGLQSVPSSIHEGGFPEQRPDRVYLLLDPLSYTAIEGGRALPDDVVLMRTVFLCTEPVEAMPDQAYLDLLERAGALFVMDSRSRVTLMRHGLSPRLLRPGYSKSLDRFDPGAARPIDALFLGSHSARRTRYLARAARVLSRYDCELQIAEPSYSDVDAPATIDADRRRLLAEAKVLISLHKGEDDLFEWGAAVDAIHAGAVVVTEHSTEIAPLIAGHHLLAASAESLPFVLEALLRDEQRLASLRAGAYERLRAWVPFALPVSVLRAAIVELVGEPLSPDAERGWTAQRPDPGSRRLPPPEPRRTADGSDQLQPQSAELLAETPAWSEHRTPRISVITVLGADREPITATLRSLARSTCRDFELIAVATAQAAHDEAAAWIADHPQVAARLVVLARDDAGLGTGRNAGVANARGAFCLVLDPGDEVYPRCLELLAGALGEDGDDAFAYPIQEVTGEPDEFAAAGGDYLMSFLQWEPERLRRGNHIHGPALIRSDTLRELGGFSEDPRLEGFEDYDLWCRIAERGGRGRLVAQAQARRRESASSSALAAIHPCAGPATAALVQRAPTLLTGAF